MLHRGYKPLYVEVMGTLREADGITPTSKRYFFTRFIAPITSRSCIKPHLGHFISLGFHPFLWALPIIGTGLELQIGHIEEV